MINTCKILFATIILSTVIFSCKKNESGPSRLTVMLTDDPAIYDSVDIDIQDIRVNASNEADKGWMSLPLNRKGIYNLLDFQNGLDTLLSSTELPAGTISQIRLVLGENNSVVINGERYPLSTPSSQQSGLKLNVHAELFSGIEYKLWIDFDAGRSIVESGNGAYILKPVIRTYTEATTGGLKGIVLPAGINSTVYAIQNIADTVGSAMPDATTGAFYIGGLAAGDYNISVHADNYIDTNVAASITTGSITDVGSLELHQ